MQDKFIMYRLILSFPVCACVCVCVFLLESQLNGVLIYIWFDMWNSNSHFLGLGFLFCRVSELICLDQLLGPKN